MKASTPLATLAPVLPVVAGMIKRPSVPVLAGVRLTVAGDVLTVSRFDYETALTATLYGGMSDGDVLVSAKALADAVKALSPASKTAARSAIVHLALDGDQVHVSVGSGPAIKLDTMPVEDYPALPKVGTRPVATLAASDVKAIVTSVVPMASTDWTIPMLTGVQLVIEPGGTSVAQATNRYIASRLTLYPIDHAKRASATLLPAPLWKMLAKLVTTDVTITDIDDAPEYNQHVTFTSGAITLTSRTLDPDFPKLGSLYPDQGSRSTVSAKTLAAAVKTAATMVTKTSPVCLTVVDEDAVEISAHSDGVERFRTAVTGDLFELRTMRLETAANPAYLLAALGAMPSDSITWQATHNLKPMVFTSGAVSVLVMPMRVGA